MIGPIRGSKLRLNGKKLKIAPYDPQKKKMKTVLKMARHKEVSVESEAHNEKKKKVVEDGTCKYCDKCLPLTEMKEHYLTHNTGEELEIHKKVIHKKDDRLDDEVVQENSISSTKILPVDDKGKIGSAEIISKDHIEDLTSKKFNAYEKGSEEEEAFPNSIEEINRECSKTQDPIIDIDDASQYNDMDTENLEEFYKASDKDPKEETTETAYDKSDTESGSQLDSENSQSKDEKNMNKESIENFSTIKSAPEERVATYQDKNQLLNIIRNPVQLTGKVSIM